MKTLLRYRLVTCSAFLLLVLGFVNYLLFQPGIHLFHFFKINTEPQWDSAPVFLTGYFSDIAWCAALYITVALLAERGSVGRAGKILFLLLPFMTEAAQYFHLINGTFDWYDLLWYGLILLVISRIFPSLKFYEMKKHRLLVGPLVLFIAFLAMAIASAAPQHTYQPKPEPCVTHKGLTYSPILVKINISGSYTMKDLSGVQRYGYEYIMERLEALSPYKYKLADGVTPNLTLNITINTDSYQHYGATLNGYVYDGSFYNSWSNDYVTPEKLFDDITAQVDRYIRYGWCKNCPSPCNP
jgi:hypothetical protein